MMRHRAFPQWKMLRHTKYYQNYMEHFVFDQPLELLTDYAMQCYAMQCYVMQCYAMLCNAAMQCYAMQCYAMLCYA